MSGRYAETFDAIFRGIFGSWSKPHLVKINGRWQCRSRDGRVGYGVNPAMAYGAWLALRDG